MFVQLIWHDGRPHLLEAFQVFFANDLDVRIKLLKIVLYRFLHRSVCDRGPIYEVLAFLLLPPVLLGLVDSLDELA